MGVLASFKFLVKKAILPVVVMGLLLTSCVENGASSKKSSSRLGSTNVNSGSGKTDGPGSLPNNTGIGSEDTLTSQKIELSHLVDPFEGTYKKKLTIPKNYKGNLYLAGLNVASLTNKIVKVRFNFGVDRQSVTLGATIARAPGIIPKTDIQVLVVDMNSKPFSKLRLGYDLYDYNDYDSPGNTAKEPVIDPRDGGLYCRGLQLEDDPTFIPLNQNSTCSAGTDQCLYAYAKITDATLYVSSGLNFITNIPSRPAIWTYSSGVRAPSAGTALSSMCLPDSEEPADIPGNLSELFDVAVPSIGWNGDVDAGYKYRGPFRSINASAWKITHGAIFGSKGLFRYNADFTDAIGYSTTGLNSNLFPRAGKISLNQGVLYQGSVDRFGNRTAIPADSTGTTKFVGGCNIRVMNYNVATTEGISSCNVSASIEVFYEKDGREINITTDKSIKLQLIRASLTNFEGKEVLASAFKSCESSTTCGASECCFNKRCWSKELVTQCVDQLPIVGNQPIGDNCSSDFECSTLCCNRSTGSCAPHNPNGTQPVACSKPAGQQCISKEFCKPEFVATCKVVRGPIVDGRLTCTLRCPAVEAYGDCRNGICIPPPTPPVPAFNPNDCSNAVDP
jgi:hypothetical protein